MENSRIFILQVLDILKEFSDENHYLKQSKIVSLLKDRDINCARRAVSRAVQELTEYGYDISTLPHKGYALFSRTFDKSEAEYLIHAVYSSKTISRTASNELVKTIEEGFSKYDRKDFSYLYKSGEISRTDNPEVFLTIGLLEEAIQKNRMVSFEYYTIDSDLVIKPKKEGKRYPFSPYYLFVNNGSYFVIGNTSPHDALSIYRISNIKDLLIESDERVLLSKVDKDFKIDEYVKDHVYPIIDKVIEAKLSFSSPNLVNQIQGWFGNNVSIEKKGEEYLATVRNGERCLYLWMIHYADVVKIISPDSLREQVMDYGKRIEEMYKG